MRRFWYFDLSVWSVDRKPYHSSLCQNSVFTPFCKDWEPVYPPNIFKRLQFPWIPLRYPQSPLRYPQGKWNANRQQQMPRNIARLSQTAPVSFLGSLAVSVGVCWHVMFHRDAVGLSGECLEGVWGKLSWSHGNWRPTNVFGGYIGSQSLQYGVKTLFWHSLEYYGFLSTNHTETSKYQNRRI